MSTPWEDRRGMFQRGKELHEPSAPRRTSGAGVVDAVRRASVNSVTGLEKTTSNSSAEPSSPNSSRRRSSNTALSNLTSMKRGGEDYGDKRGSHLDQQSSTYVGGLFNSMFKGLQKPASAAGQSGQATGGSQGQK